MIEAREYQERLLLDVHFALREGVRRILLVSPTGSGKTVTMTQLCQLFNNAGLACTFMAPRRELIKQISKKLTEQGIRHGVILAGHPGQSLYATNQVASIDTLLARAVRRDRLVLPHADVVFVDEAHLSVTVARQTLFRMYPQAVLIGVTATPSRKDGRPLKLLYDRMIQATSVRDLIDQGYLVKPRYYAPSVPDLRRVKIQAADWNQKELEERMEPLLGDIIEHWLKLAGGRRTTVFATSVKHSLWLAEQFRAKGVAAEHCDANTPNTLREATFDRFIRGDTQVLCNVNLASYGFDLPEMDCVVLARPTRSLVMYLQMGGRALRPAPGKSDALILDHAGNVHFHGFLEDDREWTLEGDTAVVPRKKPEKKGDAPKMLTCPECSTVFSGGLQCPQCGYYFEQLGTKFKVVDGELVAIAPAGTAEDPLERRRFYQELKWIGHGKNKDGWPAAMFKDKFGVWPPPEWRNDERREPSQETLRWVKYKRIQFAKRLENQKRNAGAAA